VLAAQQLAGARSLELRLGEHLAAYAKQKREAILLAQQAGDVERAEREKLRQRLDWLEETVDWHPEKGYVFQMLAYIYTNANAVNASIRSSVLQFDVLSAAKVVGSAVHRCKWQLEAIVLILVVVVAR
jgi:deoxycytidine triphosphate deaminase